MVFVVIVCASVALAACTAVKPIYLQRVIDACTGLDYEKMPLYFMIYVASIAGILIFEAVRQLLIGKYRADKTKKLKSKCLEQLMKKSIKSFQAEKGQNYLTILNQEIDMLVESYYIEILDFTYSVLVLLGSIAALIYIHYILAVLILLSTFLPILASTLQGGRIQQRTNFYTASLEKLNVMIANLISGFSMLKVNRAENRFWRVLESSNQEVADAQFLKARTRTLINILIGSLAYVGEIALVGVSIWLILSGKLSVGALIASLQLSEVLAIPTHNIAYQLNDMNSVKGIKSKILSLLKEEEKGVQETGDCAVIECIKFNEVSFSYGEKRILEKINCCFEAGKKYLIIGENGSGKSTLFKLISKFETEYEGEILVNGMNLRAIGASLYDSLGVILQNTVMFNDSLRNNITLYGSYTDEEIKNVLLSIGMDDFFVSHDLDEEYQDTKDNLSGGEKQKIALARLLLQKKKFVLMDEATSAIDFESSLQIEKRLLCDPQIALIHIEHKMIPELVALYDMVIEVKDAQLIVRDKKQMRL